MYYEVPFKAEHILEMDLQGAQKWITPFLNLRDLRTLENEWATTLMNDGEPVACAGAIVFSPQRAQVWSFLSDAVTVKNFTTVYRHGKRFLDGLPFRRLEAAVRWEFFQGRRLMLLLGFDKETPEGMDAYEIDGSKSILYSKVRT